MATLAGLIPGPSAQTAESPPLELEPRLRHTVGETPSNPALSSKHALVRRRRCRWHRCS